MSKKKIVKPNSELGNPILAKSLMGKKSGKPGVFLLASSEIEELKRTGRMPSSVKNGEPFESKVNPFFTHYHSFVKAKSINSKEKALTEMQKFSDMACVQPHIKSSARELKRLKQMIS